MKEILENYIKLVEEAKDFKEVKDYKYFLSKNCNVIFPSFNLEEAKALYNRDFDLEKYKKDIIECITNRINKLNS